MLDQRNLSFSPHVLVVRVGTTVDFPNNDRVFHNVFSFRDGKRFDLGMYPVGTMQQVTFDQPGLSRIFCNIHPNMAAYVLTVDSPYFARADESGAFTHRRGARRQLHLPRVAAGRDHGIDRHVDVGRRAARDRVAMKTLVLRLPACSASCTREPHTASRSRPKRASPRATRPTK